MSVADGLLEPWHDKLVVVAVGTDRSTGDALGPLVGSALLDLLASGEAEILGNLKAPVHANNLAEALTDLRKRWNHRVSRTPPARRGRKQATARGRQHACHWNGKCRGLYGVLCTAEYTARPCHVHGRAHRGRTIGGRNHARGGALTAPWPGLCDFLMYPVQPGVNLIADVLC